MQLNEDHIKHVVAKIYQLFKGKKKCQVCAGDKWTVSDRIFGIPQFIGANLPDSQVIPVISVTCNSCGQIILMNAISMGFQFNKDADKPAEEPTESTDESTEESTEESEEDSEEQNSKETDILQ